MPQSQPEDAEIDPVPDETGEGSFGALEAATEDAVLEQIVELLPPEQRGQLLQVMQSHRGWLPPPNMLADYERVLPGLAERIVAMPEREQAHRHKFLDREGERQFKIKRRGQDYAILAMLLILAFAGYLVYYGEPGWAAKLAMATLVGIVGIFVSGKWLDAKAANEGEESED